MSDQASKEKHSRRLHRNLTVKRMRETREFLPKKTKTKTEKLNARKKLSPRDVERFFDDEE